MTARTATKTARAWHRVGVYQSWDQADAVRQATMIDTPSLDVRVVYLMGLHAVEIMEAAR